MFIRVAKHPLDPCSKIEIRIGVHIWRTKSLTLAPISKQV